MKFLMRVLKQTKLLAEFEFEMNDPRMSDLESVLSIESWMNDNTDVRVHIHQIPSEKSND